MIPIKYDRVEIAAFASLNKENLMRYRITLGGKCGYLDERGRELTPLKYDYFAARARETERDTSWKFVDGVACVKQTDKYGLIDFYGKEIVPPKYDEPIVFRDNGPGVVLVTLRGRRGYLHKTGVEYFEE